MNILKWGCALATTLILGGQMLSAESPLPPTETREEPAVRLVLPLGIPTGLPQRITVRGENISKATTARISGLLPTPTLRLLGGGIASTGAVGDLVGVGTEWMDLEVLLPEGTLRGTNGSLVLSSAGGDSLPFPVFVAPGGITAEREPNDALDMPQDLPKEGLVRGTIANASDLDLYRIDLRSGQTLRAELWSARLGAPLDGALGLMDRRGTVLLVNDDGEDTGRDPVLEFQAGSNGTFLIRVSGGVPHYGDANAYLLDVKVLP
ncbi:MAG: PPC domain-containing protein [Verrucomicrobiales bacterium]|nr:PPC domain-containing protein [Verrucomicrobiales bacterium]